MSFSSKIRSWATNTEKNVAEFHKAIILELFTSVILDTPVLSGRLRGNWQITSGDPAKGELEIVDPEGNTTTRKVEQMVAGLDQGEEFNLFLTNNLPYAYRIEYDGWSTIKAPEGMVRKNYIRILQNLQVA